MRGNLTLGAALAAALATPAMADQKKDIIDVVGAADNFFYALRSPDKTALRRTMLDEAVIFIHDRRDPEAPKMHIVAAGDHLDRWEKTPPGTDEYMFYKTVQVDGRMAHIWGPYIFLLNGKATHCGINSMSFAKTEDGWRVANTSFTMTGLDECEPIGAPIPPGALAE